MGSLRMGSLVRSARRSKDKVTKERSMGGIKEGNENIGALAWGDERRTRAIGNLTLTNCRRILLEWIPMIYVGRRLGQLIRNKKGSVMNRKVAQDAVKGAIKTVTQGIVEEVTRVDSDARGIV